MTGTPSKTCRQCQTTKRLADFPTKITFTSVIPLRTNRWISDTCRSCENSNARNSHEDGGFWGFLDFWTILGTLAGLTALAGYLFPALLETNFFKIVMGIYIAVGLLVAVVDSQSD